MRVRPQVEGSKRTFAVSATAGGVCGAKPRFRLQTVISDTAHRVWHPTGFAWAEAAEPEVIDELERLLRQIAQAGADFGGGLDRSVQQAFSATGDERAIAAYDAVIEDAGIASSGFFRYQRDELARRLSRDNALKRLPEPLAEVAQWAIDRGLEV